MDLSRASPRLTLDGPASAQIPTVSSSDFIGEDPYEVYQLRQPADRAALVTAQHLARPPEMAPTKPAFQRIPDAQIRGSGTWSFSNIHYPIPFRAPRASVFEFVDDDSMLSSMLGGSWSRIERGTMRAQKNRVAESQGAAVGLGNGILPRMSEPVQCRLIPWSSSRKAKEKSREGSSESSAAQGKGGQHGVMFRVYRLFTPDKHVCISDLQMSPGKGSTSLVSGSVDLHPRDPARDSVPEKRKVEGLNAASGADQTGKERTNEVVSSKVSDIGNMPMPRTTRAWIRDHTGRRKPKS